MVDPAKFTAKYYRIHIFLLKQKINATIFAGNRYQSIELKVL